MSDHAGNPEDRFSYNEAQMSIVLLEYLNGFVNQFFKLSTHLINKTMTLSNQVLKQT